MAETSTTTPQPSIGFYGRSLEPRSFSEKSWLYFRVEKEREYRTMIVGEPTIRQSKLIDALITIEFQARKHAKLARRTTGLEAQRYADRARLDWETYNRQMTAFERNLPKPQQSPTKVKGPSLDQRLDTIRQRRPRSEKSA